MLTAAVARAQEPGDSVRLRTPADDVWRYGRVLAADNQELVLGQPEGLEVFNRRIIARLERWRPRRPAWVFGTWALGGLAAGTLVAALASDDASTEEVVISVAAGAAVGLGAALLHLKLRPGSWVVVPAP
jgi:hypothetical protein